MVFFACMDVLSICLAQVLVWVDHIKGRQLCQIRHQKKDEEKNSSINISIGDSSET
jgi:hypothetical protein